jgi:hypothetical protein
MTADERRLLEMLAGSEDGVSWALLLAHGFLLETTKTEQFTTYAARALRHGPGVLDRQFDQPGFRLVHRPQWLAQPLD